MMKKQKSAKGSILAYSLIILAIMFAIASSMSVVSVLEKKSAGSSQLSAQSFQVADSAVQLAIKKINTVLKVFPNDKIIKAFPECNLATGTVEVGIDLEANMPPAAYVLSFFDADNAQITDCNAQVNKIKNIKAVGTFKDTVRAIKVTVTDRSPIAWWKFDDGSGSTATDSVGAQNGTLTGASWDTGKIGGDLNFAGTGSVVTTPFTKVFSTGFTVAAWIKTNNVSGYRVIMQMDNLNDTGFYLYDRQLMYFQPTGNCTAGAGGPTLSVGQWYHVAMTFDESNNVKLYLDGTKIASCARDVSGLTWNVGHIGAVNSGDSEAFSGAIDDVKIFGTALSEEDIKTEYDKNK